MTERKSVFSHEEVMREGILAHPKRNAAAAVVDLELFSASFAQLLSGHWKEFLACMAITGTLGLTLKHDIEKTGEEVLERNAKT